MYRYASAVLVGALFAGCASIKTVEKSEPVFQVTTEKSVAEYTDCVMLQWVQYANAAAKQLNTPTGVRILVPGMGGPDEILDVRDLGKLREATLRERIPALSAKIYARTALACR